MLAMRLSNEDLKLLFRSYVATRITHRKIACLSFKQIARIFDPGSGTRRKLKIIDHITRCSECCDKFDFLLGVRRFRDEMIREAQILHQNDSPAIPVSGRRYQLTPIFRFATIFLGFVMLSSSIIIIMRQWERQDDTRESVLPIILIQPKKTARVTAPLLFAWQSSDDAQYYVLELFDATLLPIWRSGKIFSVQFMLPTNIVDRLQKGNSYYWMITAYSLGGRTAESPIFRFFFVKDPEQPAHRTPGIDNKSVKDHR